MLRPTIRSIAAAPMVGAVGLILLVLLAGRSLLEPATTPSAETAPSPTASQAQPSETPPSESHEPQKAVGLSWYQMEPVRIDGVLVGRTVVFGTLGGSTGKLEVSADSYVAGPTAGIVLVASNDESGSTLTALDADTLETHQLVVSEQRINAVTLTPDAATVYYIASGDSNVELWSIERSGVPPTPKLIHDWVLTGVEGPGTFSLLVDSTGSRLVQQYCGSTCVTRSVDLTTSVTTDLDSVHDRLLGVTESELVVMTGCCTDLVEPGDVLAMTAKGDVKELIHGVWAAKFVVTSDGSTVVVALRESSDGTVIEFLAVGIGGQPIGSPYAVPVDTPGSFPMDFVGSSADTAAGSGTVDDQLLLVPGGRVGEDALIGILLPLAGGEPTSVIVER